MEKSKKKSKSASLWRIKFDQSLVWRRWVEVYQKGYQIVDYLHGRNIKKVAIYGMADIGIALFKELNNTDIEILYTLDKSKVKCECDIEIKKLEEVDEQVDAIIVTAISFFSEIYDDLNEKLQGKIVIVGIDEILASLLVEGETLKK